MSVALPPCPRDWARGRLRRRGNESPGGRGGAERRRDPGRGAGAPSRLFFARTLYKRGLPDTALGPTAPPFRT